MRELVKQARPNYKTTQKLTKGYNTNNVFASVVSQKVNVGMKEEYVATIDSPESSNQYYLFSQNLCNENHFVIVTVAVGLR